jgi:hypothetical protein
VQQHTDDSEMNEDMGTRSSDMSNAMNASVGFARPRGRDRPTRHGVAVLQLVASLTLALSTAITATVVTIGYARADALNLVADADGGPMGVALLLGLLFAGIGGLTVLMARGRMPRE